MTRGVWTLGDCDIQVFYEDGNGNIVGDPTDPPILQYCYVEGLTISATTEVRRRGVTGRGRRKINITNDCFDDIKATCEHLFLSQTNEFNLTTIFNTDQWLRLVIPFFRFDSTPIPSALQNDTFALSYCKASQFSITAKMPEVIQATAVFEAELLLPNPSS